MRAHLDMDWLLRSMLVALRLGAFLWATPLFALSRIPMQIKALAVLVFCAALSTTTLAGAAVPASVPALGVAASGELLVGALLGFGVHCAFAAFQFGGRLLDLQMGFGVASLINPSTQEQDPLLGTLLLLTGVMTFYLLDGHHWLIRALVQSFEWFPLGHPPQDFAMEAVVAQFGLMFTLGTVLVAPIVTVLLLLDMGLAMAAKTMPQLNVFMLSIPVKIGVGLLVLAACAPYVGWAVRRILESIFGYWQAIAR